MPYNENHKLVFRWEVFNVTNTQQLTSVLGDTFSIGTDPFLGGDNGTPTASFGNLTSTQRPFGESTAARIMQSALRYQLSGGDARLRSLKVCECSSLFIAGWPRGSKVARPFLS